MENFEKNKLMLTPHYKKVITYFSKKASSYDLVDKQLYWKLSDHLLKKIIMKKIVSKFLKKKKLQIMDAGAGTGRWSLILYQLFKVKKIRTQFDLVDITPLMLKEAEYKIKKRKIDCMKTYIGNIENLSMFKDNFYDIVISFYNVLSFVDKPIKALKEIYRKLKRGGLCACSVANKYHAYYFNILTNKGSDLTTISNQSKVRFTKKMPYIHCFTPEKIRSLFEKASFKKVEVIGFPNFIYPTIEETKVKGQSQYYKTLLKNKKIFNRILNLEYKECFNPNLAARGNSLLVIGQKL